MSAKPSDSKFEYELWSRLKTADSRNLLIMLIAFTAVLGGIERLVLGRDLVSLLGTALGLPVATVILSLILARILALPGWLFRRSYDVKPMAIATSLTGIWFYLQESYFVPLTFLKFGLLVKLSAFLILWAMNLLGCYVLFLTTFPHKWGRALVAMAVILGSLSTLVTARQSLFLSSNANFQRLFVNNDAQVVGAVLGTEVTPAELSDEIANID